MSERKQHIKINGHSILDTYQPGSPPPNKIKTERIRKTHGLKLKNEFAKVTDEFSKLKEKLKEKSITEEYGVYVTLTSFKNEDIPLKSLDNQQFKLCSYKDNKGIHEALIFIPHLSVRKFMSKIVDYLTKDTVSGKPKNQPLINQISEIRLAKLESFWTDQITSLPKTEDEVWLEIWLMKNKKKETDLHSLSKEISKKLDIPLGNTYLNFFNSFVITAKTSLKKLEEAIELIDCLQEIKLAKDTPEVIVNSNINDQIEFSNDILSRIKVTEKPAASIMILDTGVNYSNPLLSDICQSNNAVSWQENWPKYEHPNLWTESTHYHGTLQAGIAAYGDIQELICNDTEVEIPYNLESGRIIPPRGSNNRELYGAITTETILKLIDKNPNQSRVCSLAITNDYDCYGLPSTWSAEIDRFTFTNGGNNILFIVSAGNSEIQRDYIIDYWDHVHQSKIEDPAQSWNAISVGAYTEKTSNNDPEYNYFSPFAKKGDISPMTSTSVAWKSQAPIKPEVVAEGGNVLLPISNDKNPVADGDSVVSLLTTSGKSPSEIFDSHRGTSAACALISKYAATLMSQYPKYKAETIRGLIIHSAEWTQAMNDKYNYFINEDGKKKAKMTMLRSVGYGVPNLEKAQYSTKSALTLIIEDSIKPFKKSDSDQVMGEVRIHDLPLPQNMLTDMFDKKFKVKVTLSYFIEPNPSTRGYANKYCYPSHNLRFKMISPNEKEESFKSGLIKGYEYEDDADNNRSYDGWSYGANLRTKGSIHSDTWIGDGADLASMNMIAIHPVTGWWKNKESFERHDLTVNYSLLISIETDNEDVDIYSEIENIIKTDIPIDIS